MIFTLIIGTAILYYCLVNLLDIDMFIKKFHGAKLAPTVDAIVIIGSLLWFIVQSFLYSGIIVIITLSTIVFVETSYMNNLSMRNKRNRIRFMLISIILLTSFIILNELYIQFNFWKYLFEL